jgi:hypothetical protein
MLDARADSIPPSTEVYVLRSGGAFCRPCPVCGAKALTRCLDLLFVEVYDVHAGRALDLSEEPFEDA